MPGFGLGLAEASSFLQMASCLDASNPEQHSCLWDWELCRPLEGAASPAGFGAFALLDGPGLTQFRVEGLGFRA